MTKLNGLGFAGMETEDSYIQFIGRLFCPGGVGAKKRLVVGGGGKVIGGDIGLVGRGRVEALLCSSLV